MSAAQRATAGKPIIDAQHETGYQTARTREAAREIARSTAAYVDPTRPHLRWTTRIHRTSQWTTFPWVVTHYWYRVTPGDPTSYKP